MALVDGNGTIVTVTIGSSVIPIGYVVDTEYSGITREEVDTTHLATVGDRTNRASRLKDNGEYSLNGWYDYSDLGQQTLADLVEDKDANPTWRVTFEDESYEQFTGWLKMHNPATGIENDSNVGFETTIRLTSAITYGIPEE